MNKPKNREIFDLLKAGYDVELSVMEGKAYVAVTDRQVRGFNVSYQLGAITNQRPALQSMLTRQLRTLIKRLEI